jgi:hypothetical protein
MPKRTVLLSLPTWISSGTQAGALTLKLPTYPFQYVGGGEQASKRSSLRGPPTPNEMATRFRQAFGTLIRTGRLRPGS